MAAELCEIYLKRNPADGNFLCLAAKANLALKNFAAAKSRLQDAIRLYPDFSLAHETLGDLLLVQGRGSEALDAYEQALRLDPANAPVHDKIDKARQMKREATEKPAGSRAGRSPPQRMPFADEIATAVEQAKRGDKRAAEMTYREILKKDPDHIEAARLLAGMAVENRRFREAEVFLRKALSNAPDYARAWVDLSQVQHELRKFDDAIASAREVLRIVPEAAESHLLFAGAIGAAGHHDEAIEAYERAIGLSPDKPGAISSMANHLKTIGRHDDAIAAYRRAIAIRPDHAEAYWSLANLKTFRFEPEEVAAMESLLENDDLPDLSRSQLHNALGFEYEARRDFERAFEHFARCNEIRRKSESYDPVDTEDRYDRVIRMFDADFLDRDCGPPVAAVTPIFVVGLPRSGSTLIEQILASHHQIEGTHELAELSRAIKSTRRQSRDRFRFPDSLEKLQDREWKEIGDEYLRLTESFRSGAPFFIDKNPNNFVHVGTIRLALPHAKIINARRHPLDSCLGSFKQLFATGQPFTYDLTEIGEYYLQYSRLMDHWHAVIPGFVLDVHYEKVVADVESEVRRILDFCGLPFEDACLRFYETERAVRTASSEQVRRPIYSSSVNLWRNYESHLDELVHILKPLLSALAAEDRPAALG